MSEDGRNTLSGIFYENFIAEELTSRGFPLFHWHSKGDSEFEFTLDHGGYAMPVYVKKRKGPLRFLDRLMEHNRFDHAVKVSGNNYGFDESRRVLTIPSYQFPHTWTVCWRNVVFRWIRSLHAMVRMPMWICDDEFPRPWMHKGIHEGFPV